MSAIDEDSADLRSYFHTIEEAFIRLRGAPLLLSAADWQLAKSWYEDGVPLDLVCRALEEVFERRRARGASGKVQGLRYCRHAVDEAWREVQELTSVDHRRTAEPLDVGDRLVALARALPERLPDREAWSAKIQGLTGSAEGVERSLERLDRELVDQRWRDLDDGARERISGQVDEALRGLAGRLDADDLGVARERLRRQQLRRAEGMPVLSLFSPEAEGEGDS